MLTHYINLSLRNIIRYKIFSAINIVGLAIGILSCIFISVFVVFELSFDNFHKTAQDIYRVNLNKSANTLSGLAPILKEDYPEVLSVVRIKPVEGVFSNTVAGESPRRFIEQNVLQVESSFLKIFNFPFLERFNETVLEAPFTCLVSASAASKYFGDNVQATGKTLEFENQSYLVEGVFSDVQKNSHLQFDLLLSYSSLGEDMDNNWSWQEDYTYILLEPGADPKALETKMQQIVEKHHGDGRVDQYWLQRLLEIHLTSDLKYEIAETGDAQIIKYLMLVAFLILVIALVNYTNISIARSLDRAQEIGIRKIIGASDYYLISLSFFEILIVNLLSLLLACLLFILLLPFFGDLVALPISTILQDWKVWTVVAIVFFLCTFICGLYPFYVSSNFKSLEVFKGKIVRSAKGQFLRKTLITAQFVISFVLLAGTLIIY